MALSRLGAIALAGTLACAASCSSSTSPHGNAPGPITFMAGDNQTDTIGAVLTQALVVRVTRSPDTGQVVQFASIIGTQAQAPFAYVQRLDQPSPQVVATDTSDANGEASVVITLGSFSGTARVEVRVPNLGLTDTAVFTIKPGHVVGLVVGPLDTTLYAGTPEPTHAKIVDRSGDSLPTSPVVSVIAGAATVSGTTVSAAAPSRVKLAITAGGYTDTTFASFVPTGTIATSVAFASQFTVVGLDGSHPQQVSTGGTNYIGYMRWAPDGAHLAFDQSDGPCNPNGAAILVTDLSGNVGTVDEITTGTQYPSYSHDGSWIYFTRTYQTRRAHPDGTADDSLDTQNPAKDVYPSPSPDGQHVAYIADMGTTGDLRILTLSTGAVTSLGINAWSPQWSPGGNQIAYITGRQCEGTISLVNVDGTGNHLLTTENYFSNFDWSPDGRWLIGINSSGGVDVIDATSGNAIPLTWGTPNGVMSVAWKP